MPCRRLNKQRRQRNRNATRQGQTSGDSDVGNPEFRLLGPRVLGGIQVHRGSLIALGFPGRRAYHTEGGDRAE